MPVVAAGPRSVSPGVHLVLLPGLDGTAELFDRLIRAAPSSVSTSCVPLPRDRVLSYDELADLVRAAVPPGRGVLLGESFSGPLALRLARQLEPVGVILCASFVRARRLGRFSALPLSLLLRAVPPVSVVRMLLSGGDEALARDLLGAVATVEPRVLASRVRMVLEVDAVPDLAACPCPVLYLRPSKDRVVSSRQVAVVRTVRPDAEVAEIDGPHLLLQARPEEAWRCIMSFLAALE